MILYETPRAVGGRRQQYWELVLGINPAIGAALIGGASAIIVATINNIDNLIPMFT
ncbi:MAG: hypothetical protein ISR50_16165 [Alphaproteobacteria bacterium]|nr:hypothetical protein [Alphaproteobacteria bacterium]